MALNRHTLSEKDRDALDAAEVNAKREGRDAARFLPPELCRRWDDVRASLIEEFARGLDSGREEAQRNARRPAGSP